MRKLRKPRWPLSGRDIAGQPTDADLSAIQDRYAIGLSIYFRVFTVSVGPLTLSWTLIVSSYVTCVKTFSLHKRFILILK